MIDGYISVKEAAEKWDIATRRIQILCSEGRINGAARLGREWAIPCLAKKPEDKRTKTGKYKNWRRKSSINNRTEGQ